MQAYLQIALDGAKEQEIYDSLRSMHEVREVNLMFGEWDILAKLDLPTAEALGTFILQKVRPIPGVRLTSTMIVAKTHFDGHPITKKNT